MKTICFCMLLALALSKSAYSDTFGNGANAFNIDFVTIGNPGNVADTTGDPNPAGSVPYTFRMGQFEISEQMIDKANEVGGLGITKFNRSANKAATGVSWNEAARFVNWLNTSTGSAPAYKFATQPGQVGYDPGSSIQLWTPTDAGYSPQNLYRNSLARYFLPSINEWYKSAYYDPTSGQYYNYPTGSNIRPDGIDFVNDPVFDAVFYEGGNLQGPNDITNVGLFSPYGTAGQGGNVEEWEETENDLVNDSPSSLRDLRGGEWGLGDWSLTKSERGRTAASNSASSWGFRVASAVVPEPSTIFLAVVAFAALPIRRRSLPHNRV
jgi:formylglycine-generating enzyme